LTVELNPEDASLEQVSRRLHLDDREVDRDYGLVNISRRRNLYLLRVAPNAADRVAESDLVKHVHADIGVEPA
jgi:hypothetical protein